MDQQKGCAKDQCQPQQTQIFGQTAKAVEMFCGSVMPQQKEKQKTDGFVQSQYGAAFGHEHNQWGEQKRYHQSVAEL